MIVIRSPNFSRILRKFSTEVSKQSLVHLKHRSIVKLSGEGVSDFLQGLITNDMKHLQEGSANIYSIFLNIKGRVLFDSIIYKASEPKIFYIECDSSIVSSLMKHLKMYKLRRQVDIESFQDKMNIWASFIENETPSLNSDNGGNESDNTFVKHIDNISIYNDPRLSYLGLRILTNSDVTSDDLVKHLEPNTSLQDVENYTIFRYKLGVGEGVENFPPGAALPLEINCDYLHGVSFHKGCYIGQELTARSYHTGVIRKRLMPLNLPSPDLKIQYDEKILNESDKVVGKFRGQEKNFGLGLLRISEALTSKTLRIGDNIVKVFKPFWWPQEAQKASGITKK